MYAVVRASTSDGSVTVSSDGVTVLPLGSGPGGIEIADGIRCTHAGEITNLVDIIKNAILC